MGGTKACLTSFSSSLGARLQSSAAICRGALELATLNKSGVSSAINDPAKARPKTVIHPMRMALSFIVR
jgi:hypothetical protein